MSIINLVIFFVTLTTTNAIISPCIDNPNCQCMSRNEKEVKVVCNVNNSTKFIMHMKSDENLQIICKYWQGWKDFHYTSTQPGKIINSLHFKHCGLSTEISLKDIVRKLGVEETSTLIFQSFKYLYGTLKKEHLQGFPTVTKLVLSGNGLTKISNDLFLDFPKLTSIDLSDNNLILPNDIFDATPNIKRIKLCRNQLRDIDPRLFSKLRFVEYLNLMGNKLVEFEEGIFDDLISLKSINLSKNMLLYLSYASFYHLKKLESIDISFNNFYFIHMKLFLESKQLRRLWLHDNKSPLETIPDYLLSNLRKLEDVFLNNNGFLYLPENIFRGAKSLRYINLNNNFLDSLPQNIFKGLRNVKQLLINNNKINSLSDRIFKDMENLEKLDLSMNRIVSVSSGLFAGLTYLTELNMEKNQLKYIEEKALNRMLLLKVAKFSHNNITFNATNAKWASFHLHRYLEELHLSHNNIKSFISDWSRTGYNLRLLDLSHNKISIVSTNDLLIPSSRLQIDLRYNRIKNIVFNNGENLENYFSVERDTVVLVGHNPLLCNCHLYDLLRCREDNLPNYNYHYFKITLGNLPCVLPDKTIGPKIKDLHSSTYKCLEKEYYRIGKSCQNNCTCYLRPKDKTRILDCSNNEMSEFLIDQSRVDYEGTYSLILNLTGNFLTEIPSIKSLKSINVTGLLLSNNQISQVTLDKLPKNLTVLELHNNDISRIDLDVLNYLKSSSLKEFTLSGNPIKCDCHTYDLLNFIQANRCYYEDLGNVKCKNMDLPMYEMTENELVCPYDSVRTVFITMLIVFLVTLVFVIWYYRKDLLSLFHQSRLPNIIVRYIRRDFF